MITVGLDFGTHQTKVCIEKTDGMELSYEFMKFKDAEDKEKFVLPTIIGIDKKGFLSYGYLKEDYEGEIKKYFKQQSFKATTNFEKTASMTYSIWFIANIIFDLEEEYNDEFVIQMGVPTDSINLKENRKIAKEILSSAYHLVEEIFKNDKKKFLGTTLSELIRLTKIEPYSDDKEDFYNSLVFPEAYACLNPLVGRGRLSDVGTSMMVDIGGGTTDISFFIIEENKPVVYAFYSIDKGLNFLIDADNKLKGAKRINVIDESEIIHNRKKEFNDRIEEIYKIFYEEMVRHFKSQTKLKENRLTERFNNRPIVYSGGGSTFKSLCRGHGCFNDLHFISQKEWNIEAIVDLDEIISKGLCPILSTSYGLAKSAENDDIKVMPFKDLFDKIRGLKESDMHKTMEKPQEKDRFNYMDDFSAWK